MILLLRSFMQRGHPSSKIIEKSDHKCDFETHDASTSHDSDHHRVKILDTILEEKRRRQIDEDSFPEIKKTPPEKKMVKHMYMK